MTPTWQLARVLRSKEFPHLKGCVLWVRIEKPKLYSVGTKRRVRCYNTNLSWDIGFSVTLGLPAKDIELLGQLEVVAFREAVPAIPKATWQAPDWQGVPEGALLRKPYLPVTAFGKSPASAKLRQKKRKIRTEQQEAV